MIFAALAILILALLLFWQATRSRQSTGLPGGQVIYSDTHDWGEVEKPLFDPLLELAGKPDYIVREGSRIIPIEVKSSRISDSPYDSHIYQLAAYCYLVEKEYGKRPPYGILHYPNRTYRIEYTRDLEAELFELIADIRYQERRTSVNRSHDFPGRCANCGYQENCPQSLV